MSKLAHSNDETMFEIEMRARGLVPIHQQKVHKCSAKTPPIWYRPLGGKCGYFAKWRRHDGKYFCTVHGQMLDEIDDGDRS